MPSYKTAYGGGGQYLRTTDLAGHQVRVVVERVELTTLRSEDGRTQKLVASFVGKQKRLVLNRTNAEAIAQVAGTDDYARWAGVGLVLYVDPSVRYGAHTGGIRVKPAAERPALRAVARPRAAVAAAGHRVPFEYDSAAPADEPPPLSDADIPF